MYRRTRRLGFWVVVLIACRAAFADEPADSDSSLPPAAQRKIDFAKDIGPLLARRCIDCHGPESEEGGLRLDTAKRAATGGDRGPAIEPGKSAESRLIRYVAGLDDEVVMPPDDEDRLTAEEIGLLRAWIDQGAEWGEETGSESRRTSDHWAFQPRVRPAIPQVTGTAWVRNEIDAFVLAKLEKMGLEPSPEADRTTLIRRLSLDLLGLPPTREQIEQFIADDSEDAYGRLVDRLLESPHYGERFARHWLDLARYADSDGYEKDRVRPWAWRYRDWVIDAMNRDLPFDQFTIEQLAGDLLENPTIEQRTATGFHRNTLTNTEGGVDQEEYRAKANVDRASTTGSVWLGLTLACTECHSHKFDPFTQREFYGLFAFFDRTVEKDIAAPMADELAAYEEKKAPFDAEHAKLQAAVTSFEKDLLPARQAEWETTFQPSVIEWTLLEPTAVSSAGDTSLSVEDDGSVFASGANPDVETYTLEAAGKNIVATAIRLEVLSDDRLPAKGPGRVKHGNFVLSELTLTVTGAEEGAEPVTVNLVKPSADFSQSGWDVAGAIDADPKTGWAIAPQFGKRHVAVFEIEQTLDLSTAAKLTFSLTQSYGKQHTIGRFRVWLTNAPRPVTAVGLPDDVVSALATSVDQRSETQTSAISVYYRTLDSELAKLDLAVAEHQKKAPAYPPTKARTMAENAEPPQTHIHIRGDFLRKGAAVETHTPEVLHEFHARNEQPDRLDLARWIVDPANPLTSRVIANRAWSHLFGRGLVATMEDFGTRGEKPSHPELLDYLADELIAGGWSMKALHRSIVLSATYRQRSIARPELAGQDPANALLGRQSRFRLESELIRDSYLAVSGLLADKIGGPSVRPPLPKGVAELGYANSVKWVESTGEDRFRRGLYIFFQRTVPYPMLTTFDSPDGNVTCPKRERTNTPLQALTLLNDPVFVECAQAFGRRIIETGPGDVEGRVRLAFRLALAREPTDAEMERLVKLHAEIRQLAAEDKEAAARLVGDYASSGAEIDDAAAWVAVGRTLLNLDEFVTRE